MDRKNCTHGGSEYVILLIAWCERCSGWRVKRVGVDCGSLSAVGSSVVYESHFLPQEETTPDELLHLSMRAFRCAQEWEQDRVEYSLFDPDGDPAA